MMSDGMVGWMSSDSVIPIGYNIDYWQVLI
jgi:hypothetical protein